MLSPCTSTERKIVQKAKLKIGHTAAIETTMDRTEKKQITMLLHGFFFVSSFGAKACVPVSSIIIFMYTPISLVQLHYIPKTVIYTGRTKPLIQNMGFFKAFFVNAVVSLCSIRLITLKQQNEIEND